MSDFDKEAERQRLREKYERDQEKRQATQRMSELLLKGATMTNRHCDECGDPIFRYDGEEFCPTCQNAQIVDGEGQQTQPEQETEIAGQPGTDEQPQTSGRGQATEQPDAAGGGNAGETVEGEKEGDTDVPLETTNPTAVGGTAAEAESATATDRQSPARARSSDLSEARESLQRSIVRFAREAESADDPRRAKELLAAAREAAEALGALNR